MMTRQSDWSSSTRFRSCRSLPPHTIIWFASRYAVPPSTVHFSWITVTILPSATERAPRFTAPITPVLPPPLTQTSPPSQIFLPHSSAAARIVDGVLGLELP